MGILEKFRFPLFILFLGLLISACSQKVYKHSDFRGVWVASVRNIDWPSSPTSNRDSLLGEFRNIAAYYQDLNFNAMVVQIRPASDAFYRSELEPWSEWYSGEQGKGLAYDEDLLPILIEEAHNRGMEFHAWLNPYRAVVNADSAFIDSTHIASRDSSIVVRYGDNLYLDPGYPESRKHVLEVVGDIVSRYDVDAIHFDDYFYPYRIDTLEFPDSTSYRLHGEGFPSKDDWRRDNVNQLVSALSDTIKQIKPWVKFGISPFGVWRNKSNDPAGSATRAGQTNYDDLYADVLLWQREGWLDYIAPQIYWHIGFELADYEVLANWWNDHDYGRHVYIGQAAHRIHRWERPEEMGDHLRMLKSTPNISGNIYFSARSLVANPLGFADSLRNDYYRYPAMTPAMPWLDQDPPGPPYGAELRRQGSVWRLTWQLSESADVREYIIYRSTSPIQEMDLSKTNIIKRVRHPQNFYIEESVRTFGRYHYAITTVDRAGNVSKPALPTLISK